MENLANVSGAETVHFLGRKLSPTVQIDTANIDEAEELCDGAVFRFGAGCVCEFRVGARPTHHHDRQSSLVAASLEGGPVNHVPDEVLAALDELGEGLLLGDPTVVSERLRSDLWLRVECDRAALEGGTTPVIFRLEHTTATDTLAGHGSFVGTIVDGVESRLRKWGVDPPERYPHHATEDGWQVYRGVARLP